MKKYIKKLREKPVRQRRQILYISTTVIMLIIFGVWITTLPFKYKDDFSQKGKVFSPSPFDTIRSDASKIGEGLSESWANVSESVSMLQEALSEAKKFEESGAVGGQTGSASSTSGTLKIIPLENEEGGSEATTTPQ